MHHGRVGARRRVTLLAVVAGVAALVAGATVVAPVADATRPGRGVVGTPGSPDSGDSLFPHEGNGGYNVQNYDIHLDWTPPNNVSATVAVNAKATQALSAFNLDFDADTLTIDNVTVNGAMAAMSHSGTELTVTPASVIADGETFSTVVTYHGSPQYTEDPDGSKDGWIPTSDGVMVVAEPIGAKTWFPCNNTPRDKATYRFVVSAPDTKTVIANGRLVSTSTSAGTTTTTWREPDQMSTYLASIAIGRFTQVDGHTSAGVPIHSYLDPKVGGSSMAAQVKNVVDLWSKIFGPYPFVSTGITTDNVPVGYSLEVQTRPVFPYTVGMPTLVHELAHQWYGDSVTPVDWSDIWLNEGFATYAEWLWHARQGHPGAPARNFEYLYHHAQPAGFWKTPVAEPGTPVKLFATDSVYIRGAMALQAIRMKMGSEAFFKLLQRWPARYHESNATTHDLKQLADKLSGKNLHKVFHDWLYSSGRPRGY